MSSDALKVLQDHVLNYPFTIRLASGVKYCSQMSQDILIKKD